MLASTRVARMRDEQAQPALLLRLCALTLAHHWSSGAATDRCSSHRPVSLCRLSRLTVRTLFADDTQHVQHNLHTSIRESDSRGCCRGARKRRDKKVSFHLAPKLRMLHALVPRTCRWWSNAEKKEKRGRRKRERCEVCGRGAEERWSEEEAM